MLYLNKTAAQYDYKPRKCALSQDQKHTILSKQKAWCCLKTFIKPEQTESGK